jgi:dUTP pyrophosphatase
MEQQQKPTTVIKFKPVDHVNKTIALTAPKAAKPGDAGFDIVSNEKRSIRSGAVAAVETPFILADAPDFLPDGSDYYIKVNSRSGLAVKHGVFPITGTIDKGYRGQIKIILMNAGAEDILIWPGDRIAQLVVHKIEAANLVYELTDSISQTERGSTGLGSTGKQ